MKKLVSYLAGVVLFLMGQFAHAGTISLSGVITALTDISQLGAIIGTADFDEGPTSGNVPAGTYSPLGMDLHGDNVSFASILPGIVSSGAAFLPRYGPPGITFPGPIGGGGVHTGNVGNTGLVGDIFGPCNTMGCHNVL